MDNPLKLNEILVSPFRGWKALVYLAIAFIPWAIAKQIVQEQGIILGGIPATLLLIGLAWLVGVLVETGRSWTRFGRLQANRRVLWGFALLVVLVVSWLYYQSGREVRWECLQEIKYVPANGGFYRFAGDEFRNKEEALSYCLEVINRR